VVADGGLLAILPDPVVCFKDAIYSQQQVSLLFDSLTGSPSVITSFLLSNKLLLFRWKML